MSALPRWEIGRLKRLILNFKFKLENINLSRSHRILFDSTS